VIELVVPFTESSAVAAISMARQSREIRDSIIQEGRTARICGIPKTACPRFVVTDWDIDWRNGWRWQDEEMKARKRP
jgi:ribosome modulation factor